MPENWDSPREIAGKEYCQVVLRADQIEKIEQHCPDVNWSNIERLLKLGSLFSRAVDALWPV